MFYIELYCWPYLVLLQFSVSPFFSTIDTVTLEPDKPSLKVEVSYTARLECCYNTSGSKEFLWIKSSKSANKNIVTHPLPDAVTENKKGESGIHCGVLILRSTTLNDTGFYRCFLNASVVFTHGTYLQVYNMPKPHDESVKNGILAAEGILLLLCVVLPSTTLLFKVILVLITQLEQCKIVCIYVGSNEDMQLEKP
uniref:Ig-like domain-containing protein n=1 Tax=Periophthalmus magnuspinnatus TaxID=409849 RepID=A0A3B4B386_9GOBI